MKKRVKAFGILFLVSIFILSPCYVYAGPLEEQQEEKNVAEDNIDDNVESGIDEVITDEIEDSEVSGDSGTSEEGKGIVEDFEDENREDSTNDEMAEADILISPQNNSYQGQASDDSGNFTNVVVFVDFADTKHEHIASGSSGRCYHENPNLTELFQGDDMHPRAMKKYLQNISFNQLNVANIFPQYDEGTNKIHPYTLKNNLDYYTDNKNGDTEIIEEIADILAASNQIPSNISLDRDGDGYVDNLMIIVPCESGNTNQKYYGHKANYIGQKTINSKSLSNYTLVPESSSYMSASSGVIIHEFLHTIGYPDLYIVNSTDQTKSPAGTWDIMSSTSRYVQYPLAYLRSAYTRWFDIPTVTDTMKGYSLYAASSATAETKDCQAVILKTDYSSTEFFVLEFRKAGRIFDENSNRTEEYDCMVPGSGLVIYRINTAVNQGNTNAPPYMLYVYRPGDAYENGYEKADKSLLDASFFSAESGRTSFGNSNVQATVVDNAITYSDGTNSGIVISNIGSAGGDQITFDITFSEADDNLKWKLESEDTTGLTFRTLDSCQDGNGALYCIAQTNAGGNSVLLKYNGGNWNKIANGPKGNGHKITVYNNEVYVIYIDLTYHVRLDKLNGDRWNNLFTSAECSNEVMLGESDKGVYFTYSNDSGNTIYAYQYLNGMKKLGDKVCYSASGYPANAAISSANGDTFVVYREAFNNNCLYVKKYNEKSNSWSTVLNGSMQANYMHIKQRGNLLYLLRNGTVIGDNETYLYVYDTSSTNSGWEQLGTNMVMDSTALEMDICFNGSTPYVVYSNGTDKTYAMALKNNQWEQIGLKVSSQSAAGVKSYYENEKLYVTFLDTLTGRIAVRSLVVPADGDFWECRGIKTDKATPQNIGETIQLNADMTGNREGIQYKFVINDIERNTWTVIKELSGTDNITWKPGRAGTYKLFMNVVDRNGKWHTYEKMYTIKDAAWECAGIRTDRNSPQIIGTEIKLSAGMSGNVSGIQYKFVINDIERNTWTVIKELSETDNVTWAPNRAGAYKIFINVVDRNKKWHTYEKLYTIKDAVWGCTGIQTDKNSPQSIGTRIKLSAGMSGNTSGMQYKFVINDMEQNTWTIIKELSGTDNIIWKPLRAGVYKIFMNVVDRNGKWHTFEKLYTIKDVWECMGITTDRNSPQIVGEGIRLNAKMSGNTEGIRYKFVINNIQKNTWTTIKGLSGVDNIIWKPFYAGSYRIFMNVVDGNGKWHTYEKPYTIKDAVWGCTGIQTDKNSPQPIGTGVRLSAGMSGNISGMQYKFVINDIKQNTWTIIKGLSETDNVTWRPNHIGEYKIFMNVVDRNGKWHTFELYYQIK